MSLQGWMDAYFLNNPVGDWIWALGWALGITAGILLIRRVVKARLAAIAAKTDTIADDLVVELVASLRKTYLLIIALGVALSWLHFSDAAHKTIRYIVVFTAVLQGLRSANVLAEFGIRHYAARRDGLDRTTLRALSYAVRAFAFVIIILVGLESAGFEVRTLLTGLGVGGIAIALAVQNILGDLFAALSIVLDKPFVVGDAIAVDAFEGDVSHIGLKSTRVRSINGEEVVFSNADLLKSRLRNLSRREARRYGLILQLAPGTPADKVARVPVIVAEAVKADGRATFQRSHLRAINPTGAEIESSILIPGTDWMKALEVRQAVLIGIMRGLERESIPLAQSTAVVPSGTSTGT